MEILMEEKQEQSNSIPEPLAGLEEISMEELLRQEEAAQAQAQTTEGPFIMAKVVSFVNDGALVDIGLKGEALVARAEFGEKPPFHVGEEIPVLRLRSSGSEFVCVSWKAAKDQMAWDEIEECFQRKMPIHAVISRDIKGGAQAQTENGLKAFIPASHIDVKPVADLKKLRNKTITAYILECERRKGNLILSRRMWLEEENQKKRDATLSTLSLGDVREGKISGIASFGAFVDLGGVEGLLHIGEIEWLKLPKMSQVFKIGESIQVKVIGFDSETGKISLSRKQLLPHPWEGIEAKYKPGMVVTGKVVNLTEFGAFVELEPKIEGLVHVSELSWTKENRKPKNVLKIGQEVSVEILSIHRGEERISLSLKRTQENPWQKFKADHPVGSVVHGTVTGVVNFGAFVKVAEGMEGLVHISDFAWRKNIQNAEEFLKVGQEVDLKVLHVDTKKEKIALGLKQMGSNPYAGFKKGAVVHGVVKSVLDQGATVTLSDDVEGFVPRNEVANMRIEKVADVLKEGDAVEAKVTDVDTKTLRVVLSIRKLEQDLQRKAQAKYSGYKPGPALKDLFE